MLQVLLRLLQSDSRRYSRATTNLWTIADGDKCTFPKFEVLHEELRTAINAVDQELSLDFFF